jgi:hypothetical protein
MPFGVAFRQHIAERNAALVRERHRYLGKARPGRRPATSGDLAQAGRVVESGGDAGLTPDLPQARC